jgi:hypothetical protein
MISIDVGIKNMAYCIFKLENNTCEVEDWNILNLVTESETSILSCNYVPSNKSSLQTLNKKTKCMKRAKYLKGDYIRCEKHLDVSENFVLPNPNYSLAKLKKCKVSELKEIYAHEGKKTKQEYVDLIFEHFQKSSWSLVPEPHKPASANKIDLITIGRNLHSQLSQIPIMRQVSYVVIENQISPIANRMKTIQGMIAQWFIIHGKSSIEFVSSSNKLKAFSKEKGEEKKSYQKNKKNGILFCRQILDNFPEKKWTIFLDTFPKKKDDLADCFLQGWWYWTERIKEKNIECGQLKNK